MTEGLVSIIMPSWNTGEYIAASIESVIAQTYRNWELIIVDDCSKDGTEAIVSHYADGRIRYIVNEEHSGAALSRNRAIREAQGEYIAFLDSDDLWAPYKLEKMVAFMRDNHYSFAYHGYEKIDEHSRPLGVRVSGPKTVTKKKMYHYGYPGCLAFMYDAKTMGQIQIKDIRKNNDYAILLQCCKKADCHYLDENMALYRIRRNSISHDKLKKKIRSHYDLFRICDERSAPVSLFFAVGNLWYGVLKKLRYEKHIDTAETLVPAASHTADEYAASNAKS